MDQFEDQYLPEGNEPLGIPFDEDANFFHPEEVQDEDFHGAQQVEESIYTDDPVRVYLREMGSVPLLTREGEVDVYGLSDSQLRRTYKFPGSIVYKKFSDDGKQLFVLTRDQTAYVLDLNATTEQPASVVKATAQ